MTSNMFHATGLFLYPQKTSEYLGFIMFSEDIERSQDMRLVKLNFQLIQ